MHKVVFVFILLFQTSFFLLAEEVTNFTPLADNERLAFTVKDYTEVTFYAVDSNNFNDFSLLFSLNPALFHGIQFSDDFRMAFFVTDTVNQENGRIAEHFQNLYIINGHTGEISRILTFQTTKAVRVSLDGRFLCFLSRPDLMANFVNIYLFDIERGTMIDKFVWHPWENVDDQQISSQTFTAFRIFRFDNIFKIYADIDGGIVGGVILDPETLTLDLIWNDPSIFFTPDFPYAYDHSIIHNPQAWLDDVSFGAGNLNNLHGRIPENQ